MFVDNSNIIYKPFDWREIKGCRTAACKCGAIGFPNELITISDLYITTCPNCGQDIGLYCITNEDYKKGFRWSVQ